MKPVNFSNFLSTITSDYITVIDSSIDSNEYVPIDLSSKNKELQLVDVSSSKAWEDYTKKYLKKSNAKVAFGGYSETRDIYSRSSHFKKENSYDERNIHLGIDFWCDAGTKVLAALDGEIHSFKNNTNFGDYGPTIILKHFVDGVEFFSLYGHLSKASIEHLKVGNIVKQGKVIGYLGDATVNGDYAPHLHFQLIKDMQGNSGDYPGVCSRKDLVFYSKNCPDPNLFLKLK